MFRSSKLLLAAAVCGAIGFGAMQANATDVTIPATMTASGAVVIAGQTGLDFASLDFAAVHSGVFELGPDGNVGFSTGPVGLTPTGTPVAGQIQITDTTNTLDITCEATGVISDGVRDVNITEVKWDAAAVAPTYAAAANTCGGLGVGVISIDTSILANNNPVLNIGAQLTMAANILNGSSGSTAFDTATGNGDPIVFRIVVQ